MQRLALLSPLIQSLQDHEERRNEQHRKQRRGEHAGEYGDADRLSGARAGTAGENERRDAENEGEGRHQDGSEAGAGSRDRGFDDGLAAESQFSRYLDDEDRVL